VSRCSAVLRQFHHLRRYVTDDCFRLLMTSLVHSRLDYRNFVLVELPAYLQRHIQSVLNAAARLVFQLRPCHGRPCTGCVYHNMLTSRWLFRVLHGLAPSYLNQLVRVASPIIVTPTACATIPANNRRPTYISSRCIISMELLAI